MEDNTDKTTTGATDASNIDLIKTTDLDVGIPHTQETHAPITPQTTSSQNTPLVEAEETQFEREQRLKLNADQAPISGKIDNDIANILKEIKLPERRDFKGAADIKPARAVIVETPKEEQKATEAPQPEEEPVVVASHTLKDDIQNIVRRKKISLVQAVALEQDKKHGQPEKVERTRTDRARSRRLLGSIFIIVVLFGLGSLALFGVYVVTQNKTASTAPTDNSILFAEQSYTISIDTASPLSLKQALVSAENQTGSALGSITRIIPTISTTTTSGQTQTSNATLSEFLSALGANPPGELLRGLSDQFFFGIHTADMNAPVFVIPVTSYDHAFSGMLAWEPTMDSDLAPVFTSVSTLVSGPNNLPVTRTFTDAVMRNYDVRALKDNSGNIVLYYSFPTPDILIIAQSPYTLTEVLSRLQAARKL